MNIVEIDIGDRPSFELARSNHRPFVMRGLVRNWPLCIAARHSTADLAQYLLRFYNGVPVHTMLGAPDIAGRLFYAPEFQRLNFRTREMDFRVAFKELETLVASESTATLYIGSASEHKHWRGLGLENPLPLLAPEVNPNLWMGVRSVVGPHNDFPENIACVVAGRRRFRLFPPEQIGNLYIGPLEFNPAGRPVSLVSVTEPDLRRFPRYAAALDASQEAELQAGDAIYIPSMWWHSVESLDAFNMLANYWWQSPGAEASRGDAALVHALLAIAPLPKHQRQAWRAVFDHLVFAMDGDPVAHIPTDIRGMLGQLTPDLRDRMRNLIRKSLQD